MVTLYKDAAIILELQKHIPSNLYITQTIKWESLATLWYQCKDDPTTTNCCEEDAVSTLYFTKSLLYESGILTYGTKPTTPPKPAEPLQACRSCNANAQKDWSFCPYCGDTLSLKCVACHKELKPEFRICPFCETPVRRATLASQDSHKTEDEYRALCRGAYLDGVLTIRERTLMNEKRLELGLPPDVADRIERECAPPNVVEYEHLVEGVLVDGVITDIERQFLDRKAQQLGIDQWTATQIEDLFKALLVTPAESPGRPSDKTNKDTTI